MFLIFLKVIVIIALVIGFVTAAFNQKVRKWIRTELINYGWQVLSVVCLLMLIYIFATQGT